jgi:hypothetical protein
MNIPELDVSQELGIAFSSAAAATHHVQLMFEAPGTMWLIS